MAAPAAGDPLAEAQRDIDRGVLKLRVYGLPGPAASAYHDLIRRRFGIEVEVVAGCIVEPAQMERVRAYNDRMRAEIAARYGPDALDWAAREARQTLRRRGAPGLGAQDLPEAL